MFINPTQHPATQTNAAQASVASPPPLTRARLKPVTPLLSPRFEHKSLNERSHSLIRNEKPIGTGFIKLIKKKCFNKINRVIFILVKPIIKEQQQQQLQPKAEVIYRNMLSFKSLMIYYANTF